MIEQILALPMDYSKFYTSYSPFSSNIGILGDEEFPGIRMLVLHYNRFTRAVWNPFIKMPGEIKRFDGTFQRIRVETDSAQGELRFYQRDAFVFHCRTLEAVEFFCQPDAATKSCWAAEKDQDTLVFQGYTENGDERDPDTKAPFLNGMKVLKGKLRVEEESCFVEPDAQGEIYVAVAVMVLEISMGALLEQLNRAPESEEQAKARLAAWVQECIGEKLQAPADAREREVFLRAVSGLLFNLAWAPGYLSGHLSCFPSRGGYPTHFLWDTAFQNLGYEQMNPVLAKEFILQLTDNMRPDGKIPMFLSSTWVRPHESQPALIGWMALRYFDEVNGEDRDFMETVFEALERNNNWWLTQRMTRFGLLFCDNGLETGQDDSPRFDEGSILALDMNSYLVNQLRCTAELGRRLGREDAARKWDTKAEKMATLMVQYLYDPEQNLFFDACAVTGKRMTLMTPAAFFPLWCGVPLAEDKSRRMITDWLLNPEKFYGDVPFPSVAYDEPTYRPYLWWRGPLWLAEAWIMLETLEKHGFAGVRREAMTRLYSMMLKDGQLHEHFNSQTGEGLGNAQQGWTAAIFCRMQQELGQ